MADARFVRRTGARKMKSHEGPTREAVALIVEARVGARPWPAPSAGRARH
jgi:hypothetical protein